MLFIESRISRQTVEGAARTHLLERLQERGLVPLIRSARLHCFELALFGPERTREMERQLAARAEAEGDAPYVSGDLFCFEDVMLFLIFGEHGEEADAPLRAGIIYRDDASDPQQKLDDFCRNLSDALEAGRAAGVGGGSLTEGATGEEASAAGAGFWRPTGPRVAEGFRRFASTRDAEASAQGAGARGKPLTEAERARVFSLLEGAEARRVLRRLVEARAEGRADALAQSVRQEADEPLLGNLEGAGLVKREVLVSCRRQGRALFRLPSMDAFQTVTATAATCIECGSALADERVEELLTPTDLASTMLRDCSWMASRLSTLLREELGLPADAVALRTASDDCEAHAMANVAGESFLFYLRDGDVTAAHARRALDIQTETEAAHLVVITTGKIQEDGRLRLREHARRRAQRGGELEVMLVEGIEGAASELRHAFERVSQRRLAAELYPLDASLGLSVGRMVATRFRLAQKSGALRDLAASAAATLAGNLREF